MPETINDPRYPIGKYEPKPFSAAQKQHWLNDIKFLPLAIEQAVLNLDEHQMKTPYREGGWTIHQVVHHVADSHMNAYCRFKIGLTEDNGAIRTYEEKKWAELDDVENLPVNISITLLHALHIRWHAAIRDLTDDQWNKTIFHPVLNKSISLWYLLGMYSWHGKHHVAHISSLRELKNW